MFCVELLTNADSITFTTEFFKFISTFITKFSKFCAGCSFGSIFFLFQFQIKLMYPGGKHLLNSNITTCHRCRIIAPMKHYDTPFYVLSSPVAYFQFIHPHQVIKHKSTAKQRPHTAVTGTVSHNPKKHHCNQHRENFNS